MLNKIISSIFGISEDKINDDLLRENTSEWDSFNHLLLINELESKFNINFTIQETESITSVSNIINLLKSKGVKYENI